MRTRKSQKQKRRDSLTEDVPNRKESAPEREEIALFSTPKGIKMVTNVVSRGASSHVPHKSRNANFDYCKPLLPAGLMYSLLSEEAILRSQEADRVLTPFNVILKARGNPIPQQLRLVYGIGQPPTGKQIADYFARRQEL